MIECNTYYMDTTFYYICWKVLDTTIDYKIILIVWYNYNNINK